MKAFLPAAGLGSRLRPLTEQTPKCLVEIAGKPLMAWWMELFRRHDVSEVLINTHYHREQVRAFIAQHNEENGRPYLRESYEEALLGSGGMILANRDFVKDEEDFFICYADNLTQIDLTALRAFHLRHRPVLTMALSPSNTPKQAGIVSLDENNVVTKFEEKPENPESDLANAGVYVAGQAIFNFFPQGGFIDFSADVLPKLAGQMYGYPVKEYHIDIGTPENLRRAKTDWQKLLEEQRR
ncbi:MAG: nucleotidyltransferase family protein [Lachnospiraceae bacterium]|jgi:mannose-1-phosphate guanylyltransferase|nr:nucleotidyltransferase family protein [Lachnospiraceae bacterium]